jgi:predicted ATPase
MSLTPQLTFLESADLIRLTTARPEVEYLFRHVLTQNAAYATLLKAEQKRIHQVVGEALESLYPDRQVELAGLLAHHFAAAGDRHKAIRYARQAAQRAEATYAYEEAVYYLRTALNLVEVEEDGQTYLALLEEAADAYRLLRDGRQALALYQQALEQWRGLADAARVIALRLHRKIIQTVSDTRWAITFEQQQDAIRIGMVSRASLEEALDLLVDQPPHSETVALLTTLANDAWRNRLPPDWQAAEDYALAALNVAEQLDDPAALSMALGGLTPVYLGRGLLRDHLQTALRRLANSAHPALDNQREQVDSLRAAGSALMTVGQYAQALPHLQQAESQAAQIQDIGQQFNALSLQLQCHFRLDRWDDALRVEAVWRDLEQHYPRERVGVT